MPNAGFQRERRAPGTIATDQAIAFNSQVVNYDTNVKYNASTFFLDGNADYYVSWFVTIKTALGTRGPSVSLITNDDPSIIYTSNNSMKTGQISGSAVIRSDGTTTFQLVNTTGQSIVLADNVDVTANISIIQINGTLKSGIVLQATNSAGATLDGGAIIPFDTVFSQINGDITNADGTISLNNDSRYFVHWTVSLDGSLDATSIKFNLVSVTETESTVVGTSESPVVLQGSFYGSTIVYAPDATTTPFNLRLVNASEDATSTNSSITLANIGIQASITIVEI
ncbi:hypothetical protein SAMN04487886_11811 [Clostridium sp. DSM 8431]|uniref:hypothetical protein n=1 Tax=Clostridium sp. DSM 8431 TaxID=1761781 RepID=UPI0008F39081|nr:hypothetical protein [Clostridium sp. DSM 8431]SFU81107.1 hypothetical protein SAMN04487886_11811 [Clostridium sp. DSM 8431]